MDPTEMQPAADQQFRILTRGTSNGQCLEVIEYGDGSVAIVLDGSESSVYRRGGNSIETCIRTYLGLLRRDAEYRA